MNQATYWVYILNCSNGSYYTGYTNNVMRRYQEHVNGTAKCKYTRSFKPLSIAQSWKIGDSKILAMSVEKFVKKLSRTKKEELIFFLEKLTSFIQAQSFLMQGKSTDIII